MAAFLFPFGRDEKPCFVDTSRKIFVAFALYLIETLELPFTIGEILRQVSFPDLKKHFSARKKTRQRRQPTVTTKLSLWDNPIVDAATSESDFDLRDLCKKRMTIYIAAKTENLSILSPVINLFSRRKSASMSENFQKTIQT